MGAMTKFVVIAMKEPTFRTRNADPMPVCYTSPFIPVKQSLVKLSLQAYSPKKNAHRANYQQDGRHARKDEEDTDDVENGDDELLTRSKLHLLALSSLPRGESIYFRVVRGWPL